MSSQPVTEIVILQPGPNFSAETFEPLAEVVKAQPGCQRLYWGRTFVDDQAVVFVDWDTIEHHQAFIQKPDIFKPFSDSKMALVLTPPSLFHVPFEPFPPIDAMKGPVIELAFFIANEEPGAKEEVFKGAQKILALTRNHKCTGTAFGFSVEEPNKLVLALSWPSREAHIDEFQQLPEFAELFTPLRKYLSGTKITHVEIQQA